MYRQILVPLDGSKFAEAALPLALALSNRAGADVHLVTVVEPIPSIAYEGWAAAASEWSEEYLRAACQRLSAEAGGEVAATVRSGHVVAELLAEARGVAADVVVMATHGSGVLTRPWLGSVTDGFVTQADRPMILVRPAGGEMPKIEPFEGLRTMLIPLDGSELSECALGHAIELGELFGAALHLTRIVSYPMCASPYLPNTAQRNKTMIAEARTAAAEYLEDHAERLRKRGLRVAAHARVDAQPGEGILKEAEEVGCDLIAMATHGRGGATRFILGSAAEKVLRDTRVPLMLYRPTKMGDLPTRRRGGRPTADTRPMP